jgi:two-component system sensor histidine kinase KdpD
MVDLTPRALLNRLARGVVYPPDRARAAMQNFFKESTLVALRELAMRQAAYAVESRMQDEEWAEPSRDVAGAMQLERERLLLLLGPDPASAALIRRGRRMADYLRAECLAVYVSRKPGFSDLAPAEQRNLERHFNFARGLLIETRVLEGTDVAETVVNFARLHQVTQIFVSREKTSARRPRLGGSLVQQIVNRARDMQVTVVADRSARRTAG